LHIRTPQALKPLPVLHKCLAVLKIYIVQGTLNLYISPTALISSLGFGRLSHGVTKFVRTYRQVSNFLGRLNGIMAVEPWGVLFPNTKNGTRPVVSSTPRDIIMQLPKDIHNLNSHHDHMPCRRPHKNHHSVCICSSTRLIALISPIHHSRETRSIPYLATAFRTIETKTHANTPEPDAVPSYHLP
jgi:hypothetical protein